MTIIYISFSRTKLSQMSRKLIMWQINSDLLEVDISSQAVHSNSRYQDMNRFHYRTHTQIPSTLIYPPNCGFNKKGCRKRLSLLNIKKKKKVVSPFHFCISCTDQSHPAPIKPGSLFFSFW